MTAHQQPFGTLCRKQIVAPESKEGTFRATCFPAALFLHTLAKEDNKGTPVSQR